MLSDNHFPSLETWRLICSEYFFIFFSYLVFCSCSFCFICQSLFDDMMNYLILFFFFFLPDWLLEWHWQASVGPEWKCSVQWQLSDGEQDGSRDDHYGIVPLSFLCFYLVSVIVWKQWKWIRQRRKKNPNLMKRSNTSEWQRDQWRVTTDENFPHITVP